MNALFSATREGDEELTDQVASDIEDAKDQGVVDTDEVTYESDGTGKVHMTDKETGEITVAERNMDGSYDLSPSHVTGNLEGFLHPERDGVTHRYMEGVRDEDIRNHVGPDDYEYPEYENHGFESDPSTREFSVHSDNYVVQRIFSDQDFCDRIFSEVIESEETAVVGDLKVEKLADERNAVVVTSEKTGDQVKVVLNGDEMDVTELDSKEFSNGFEPLHVVGIDSTNHVLVDAPEYSHESASHLVRRLEEMGVQGVRVFESAEEARDYAYSLIGAHGVEDERDVEEPEQAEFSDHTVYLTRYYSHTTNLMDRMFSDAVEGEEGDQEDIEDAIESGEQVEDKKKVITPIDEDTAVVEDKETGEFTLASLEDDSLEVEPISEKKADKLIEEAEEEQEKKYSHIYSDLEGTKFFSVYEGMTDYMQRLFSEDEDQDDIEDAIESGEEVEDDNKVITPVDDSTAVIEDKESGEYTKAVVDGDDIDVTEITKREANELLQDVEVEDKDDDEDEKQFSDIYSDEYGTKFFSAYEGMTDYMQRLFSEDEDQDEIEDAIKSGEEVEDDDKVITPIDDSTAVIEDKETGEFTKAVVGDEDIDVTEITKREANELLQDVEVEDKDDDEDEKQFSDIYSDEYGTKFFSAYEGMTDYMQRLFSEDEDQDEIEDAIKSGEEVEDDDKVITPIDDSTAVIEDKETGEFTKAVVGDEDIDVTEISKSEAKDLMSDVEVEDNDEDEDEKKFSDIYSDEYGTKFFSASEYVTSYMERLFSEDEDQDEIEDAIESGEEVEDDDKVITPINDSTAVIEDKETGEFTKAIVEDGDGTMEVTGISKREAKDLMSDVEVEDNDEDEDEKKFSDIYSDEYGTKLFSANEYITSYMERLFSEDEDQDEIEDAIESGEEVEDDDKVITPIDDSTAVIEDKETGEFTKATVEDDNLEVLGISRKEAKDLMADIEVEDDDRDEEEKKFSRPLDKFFSEAGVGPNAQAPMPAYGAPQLPQGPGGQGDPGMMQGDPNQMGPEEEPYPSVEAIEDKALAAVQSIQAAAAEAESQILNAKAQPAADQEQDLQEAQFSQRSFTRYDDALTWLNRNQRRF